MSQQVAEDYQYEPRDPELQPGPDPQEDNPVPRCAPVTQTQLVAEARAIALRRSTAPATPAHLAAVLLELEHKTTLLNSYRRGVASITELYHLGAPVPALATE